MAFLTRLRQDKETQSAAVLWLLYSVVMTAIAYRSHFAILANDAFPLLFQAESLSWSDPRSFYNGFFPIGYPLLLRTLLLFGRQHIDATGVFFNFLISAGAIWALMKLFVSQGWSRWWAVLATTIAIFLPEMLRAILSLRPDHVVMVLTTVALLCYQRSRFGYAGSLLGFSCLFRTHALALIIAFAIVTFFYHNRRHALKLVLCALPFLLLQGVLNLAAGESLTSSSQAFNIAKMMYGADWRQDQSAQQSALSVVLQDPFLLLRAYVNHLLTEWYFLLIFLIALIFRRTREFAIIATLYFLAVGLGGSPRGSLPVQPIAVLCVFGILAPILQRRSFAASISFPVATSIGIVVASALMLHRSAVHAGERIERYQDVGDRLGMRSSDDAKRVLTDDFAMYFPKIRNASPYVNGGWGLIGIPLYRERMPQFMYADPKRLHDSLASHGVDAVVLRQPTTDAGLEAAVLRDSALFLRQKPDISGYAVYRVR